MGYTYDDFGRTLQTLHSIDGTARVISENSWNDRDQLIRKVLGNGLQSIDYTYNNRGWLTSINQPFSTSPTITDCNSTPIRTSDQEGVLTLLDAEIFCGQATGDMANFLANRFDATYNFDCYNPCENTGGVHGELDCTATEINTQLASFQTVLNQMRTSHSTTRQQPCEDGSTATFYDVEEQSLALPTRIYRLQLCDDSEVHVLEDHLSQLSGNYLILYSFEITNPYQIIPVSNVDGITRQMNLEELLTTLLTGDTEAFYLQDYQRNIAPCEPQAFDCNSACLLYTSPSPRDLSTSRMPSSA